MTISGMCVSCRAWRRSSLGPALLSSSLRYGPHGLHHSHQHHLHHSTHLNPQEMSEDQENNFDQTLLPPDYRLAPSTIEMNGCTDEVTSQTDPHVTTTNKCSPCQSPFLPATVNSIDYERGLRMDSNGRISSANIANYSSNSNDDCSPMTATNLCSSATIKV